MESNQFTWKKEPNTEQEVKSILTPLVSKWFYNRFPSLSLPQLFGVLEIHSRNNILVSAPTGATKTLTGFLSVLNELVDSAQTSRLKNKVYAVYVSPLKALSNDIHKNLKEPLAEMEELAGEQLGIRVGVRTGDTTPKEKANMLKHPPHILITTPESLSIMLASPKFKEHLTDVEWCIVDEIHAIAENKRGTHLSITLEKLAHLSSHMCRVGLSATVSPLEKVAHYLVGKDRPCKIIDIQYVKNLDFKVISPVPDLIDTTHEEAHTKLYRLIDELVSAHRTTLIFTNTRAATERVVDHLKNKFPTKYVGNIGAHHGSLSKDKRFEIEDKLRKGELKAVVCSTSLELGIDIGYIDLVLCLSSPKSVARFLQRAGRSGHKLHETVKARIIVLDRDDLVECAVLMKSAKEKKIDRVHIPTLALDVLAQQIIGACIEQKWSEKELYQMITKSYCYENLTLIKFNKVLSYLAGEYTKLEDRRVYAKIWREDGLLGKRGRLARVLYMTNIGTIPDSSFMLVKIGKEVIGKLDEGFVERLKPGDVFVLGGDTYMFKYARGMTVQVCASVNRPPTVPRWFSEMLPLSFDLAREIGKLRRFMLEKFTSKQSATKIIKFLHDYLYVGDKAATSIYEYFKEQYDYCKEIPNDKRIIIEYFNDGYDNKIIFHTLFGRRVNDCLSRAVAYAIGKIKHKDVEIGINDNGFYIKGDRRLKPLKALKLIRSDKLHRVMEAALYKSEILKRRFRHCAGRSFMILRNYLGKRKPVGRQQVSAQILLSAVREIDPNFSILEEAMRECLEDLMDIENTTKIIEEINKEKIKIIEMDTKVPSPFGLNLAVQGYADIMRIEDKYEFLKRMHEQIKRKIAGKETIAIVGGEFAAKSKQRRLEFKERLRVEAMNVQLPKYAKAELIKIINGERRGIDSRFIEGINSRRAEIEENWPIELRKFLFTIFSDLKTSEFSYEDFWICQQDDQDRVAEELKINLINHFNEGAKRAKLDPQIKYDVYYMINGSKEKYRPETKKWLKELFKGAVPSYWKDDIAKFLQEKLNKLF